MDNFGLLTNKIVFADDTELEGKIVDILNGFITVYDAPGVTHCFIYSASQIKSIEIGEAEEDPEVDPQVDPDTDSDTDPEETPEETLEETTEG